MNGVGIATLRFNYPYSEKGSGMDGLRVQLATVRMAVALAGKQAKGLPLFAGGHSMSGRMMSTAEVESPMTELRGIVFFAFPLYSGKPSTDRAEHLKNVKVPMLFVSGQRDNMADLKVLKSVAKELGKKATLHLVDTADHGFNVRKRRASETPAQDETAPVADSWMKDVASS